MAGLASRISARRAAKWGAAACMVEAARMTFGNIVLAIIRGDDPFVTVAWFIGASLIPAFFALTGALLWRGKDWIAGTIATLVLAVDVVLFGLVHLDLFRPLSATAASIAVLALRAVIGILILNGVRGVLALRSGDFGIPSR